MGIWLGHPVSQPPPAEKLPRRPSGQKLPRQPSGQKFSRQPSSWLSNPASCSTPQQQQHTASNGNGAAGHLVSRTAQPGAREDSAQPQVLEPSPPTDCSQQPLWPRGGLVSRPAACSTPQPRRLSKTLIAKTLSDGALRVFLMIAMCSLVGLMMQGNATIRDPPSWSPEMESRYPFRDWVRDAYLWIQASTLTSEQQMVAAIILRLSLIHI